MLVALKPLGIYAENLKYTFSAWLPSILSFEIISPLFMLPAAFLSRIWLLSIINFSLNMFSGIFFISSNSSPITWPDSMSVAAVNISFPAKSWAPPAFKPFKYQKTKTPPKIETIIKMIVKSFCLKIKDNLFIA